MNTVVRAVLGVILIAVIGSFLRLITRPDPTNDPTPRRFTSSRQCAECHQDVFDEWHGSHHQIAYENPEVQRLSDDFRNKECQACHLPRPVSETGLLKRTLPRLTRPDEGIGCITCHIDRDGSVIGMNSSDAGCAPRGDVEFMSVSLCETCHNQHKTTDQWRASRYAADGIGCRDCHMTPRTRRDGSSGLGHVFEGCHDIDMLRKAATFTLTRDGNDVVATLTNSGAGHNFPTEERHRAVDIVVRFVDSDGVSGDWVQLHRFRQPYRDEPGENTQLPARESFAARQAIEPRSVRAEARLWYRLNPYSTDDDDASTLLFTEALELE